MIHRLLHPQVLQHPALLPWLERVCAHFELNLDAPEFIASLCGPAHTQVLLGIEEERPVALLITQLPTPLMLQPTILLGYNAGSKAIGAALIWEASEFIRKAGFNKFFCTNRSGRPDAAYERGLRPHGTVIERATTLLVELRKEEENGDEVRREPGMGVRAA